MKIGPKNQIEGAHKDFGAGGVMGDPKVADEYAYNPNDPTHSPQRLFKHQYQKPPKQTQLGFPMMTQDTQLILQNQVLMVNPSRLRQKSVRIY